MVKRMKKTLVSSLLILLSLLLILGASGCTPAAPDPNGPKDTDTSESTSETETEAKTEVPLNLKDFFGGTPDEYVVLYSSKAPTSVNRAAKGLAMSLNARYGTSIRSRADSMVEASKSKKEILIGSTNRTESTKAAAELKNENDFIIRWSGTRLVVIGNSAAATVRAIDYLTEHYLLADYDTLMLEEDLDLDWNFEEKSACVFELAKDYQIVYSSDADDQVRLLANELATTIKEMTDVRITATSDRRSDGSSATKEILLGETNRAESTEAMRKLNYLDYEIGFRDNKVVLAGGSYESLRRAVSQFIEMIYAGEITSLSDPELTYHEDFMTAYDRSVCVTDFDSFTPVWAGEFTPPSWLFDLDEKIYSLTAMNGRNMSAVNNGDGVHYPLGSAEAIASAIKAGVDLVTVDARETKDGVLVIAPSSELSFFTNAGDLAGINGNPISTELSEWTWEQVSRLRLLDADRKASEYGVVTLFEVIELCRERCLLRVEGHVDYDFTHILYQLLGELNAYRSHYEPDPDGVTYRKPHTLQTLEYWFSKDESSEELATIVELYDEYINKQDHWMRMLWWVGGEETTSADGETPEAWTALREEKKTFLYSCDIVNYCKYIAENYEAATEDTNAYVSNDTYTIRESDLGGRVLVVSDMHYFHKNNDLGYTMDERIQLLVDYIMEEYNGRGLDAVLILGDLSTDNYTLSYDRDPGGFKDTDNDGYIDHDNEGNTFYMMQFIKRYMEKLPVPVFALPGNHDSFTNEIWRETFGYDRQYSFTVGSTAFLMLDTFNGDGHNTAGADYTGVDTAWVNAELAKYQADNSITDVIVSSHYFQSPAELRAISEANSKVRCFFHGHTHIYKVTELNTGAYIINEGGFSYTAFASETTPKYWDFGFLDLRTSWGYQIVEWNADTMVTYHYTVKANYKGTNMDYSYTDEIKTTDITLRE